MTDEKELLTERLKQVKDAYYGMGSMIDSLPEQVPDSVKKILKDSLTEDAELKRLMQGIEENRPPRFLMVGRTGVGKSSLINAICNTYTAPVSDVRIGTKAIEQYPCYIGNRLVMEIMDSRGIGESLELKEKETAEAVLLEEVKEFQPDAILFVLRCKSRDRLQEDIGFVKKLRRQYALAVDVEIPIFVVLNQADEMEPSQYKVPKDYPHRKIENIESAKREVQALLKENKLPVVDVIPVSAMIDWGYTTDELEEMTAEQLSELQMEFDGRYHIEELVECLVNNLEVDASMGLMMANGLDNALRRIGMKVVKIFAALAAAVASTPIPLSDIVVLSALQVVMVMLIGYLNGNKLDWKSAQKFIIDVMGVGLGGQIFRLTARQLSKLIPVAGEMISAGVAYKGTELIGRLAVEHYVSGVDLHTLRKKRKKEEAEIEEEEEKLAEGEALTEE